MDEGRKLSKAYIQIQPPPEPQPSMYDLIKEQTEVLKRIAAALERAVEVKPWEK